MTAQIIPFPKAKPREILTPLDVWGFCAEATIYWMELTTGCAGITTDTAPCDIVPFDKDSA